MRSRLLSWFPRRSRTPHGELRGIAPPPPVLFQDGGRRGAKSACTRSIFGMPRYRSTRYPAFLSCASRFSSRASLPSWLLSSSSTIATTLNDFSQITKSARLPLNVLRTAIDLAESTAPNETCERTMISGSAPCRRKYIACSFRVSGHVARGTSLPRGERRAKTTKANLILRHRLMFRLQAARDVSQSTGIARLGMRSPPYSMTLDCQHP